MTIFSFPAGIVVNPQKLKWSLQSNTQMSKSPLNGSIQTLELPGARWAASFVYDAMRESDSAPMQAFLVQLRGMANRFYLYNWARPKPNGVATGAPRVNGANQTGTSLITAGWTPGTAGILKAGDYFGVNGELKMIVTDAASDGTGASTLTFEPPLRASPPTATTIITNQPTAVMLLTKPTVQWDTKGNSLISSFQFDCIEDF